MSHLVIAIEQMIAKYVEIKIDYDALRTLTGPELETTMRRDEESCEEIAQHLLHMVLDEINWDKIVDDAKADMPDEDEELDDDDI